MAVIGEVTGKEGVVSIGGTPIAVSDFTVKFERETVSYPQVGQETDFSVAGKLKISGELKRMLIDGAMLARVIGGNLGTGTIAPGDPIKFDLVGKLEQNGKHVTLYLDNCYPTAGNFTFGDANEVVEESVPFIIQNPDVDMSGNYSI